MNLQNRLIDRLTGAQGVSYDDARSVVTTFTYNKAASYGHMREAGATHDEALSVIGLDSPSVSVLYGQFRAAGQGHATALNGALHV